MKAISKFLALVLCLTLLAGLAVSASAIGLGDPSLDWDTPTALPSVVRNLIPS